MLVEMKAWVFLGICVLAVSACRADSAEERVQALLARSGIQEGYDKKTKRFVAVAECLADIAKPAEVKNFLLRRDELEKMAYFSAKAEIMRAVSTMMSGKDTTRITDDAAMTTSTLELFSKVTLPGCIVLCSAESYDAAAGRYGVAVAVAWSKKLQKAGSAVRAGLGRPADGGSGNSVDALKAWAEKNELATMLGCRRFTDAAGRLYFVGIGFYDAEGAQGRRLDLVRKQAAARAANNVIFELFCDDAAQDVSAGGMAEVASADKEAVKSWGRFVSLVTSKCGRRQILATTLHAGFARHPVTGRRMCICLCGVGPISAAEVDE
jgi:hypothetical protein